MRKNCIFQFFIFPIVFTILFLLISIIYTRHIFIFPPIQLNLYHLRSELSLIYPETSTIFSVNNYTSESYITHNFYGTNKYGRIGNWLYEFISLYGIARTINRKPFIDAVKFPTVAKRLGQLGGLFPYVRNEIEIIKIVNSSELLTVSLHLK